ncbi:MAG: GntR family transcriptional regulator [Blastocatellia bacterium]
MIQWFIDKNNKVPLYLQIKDLIKYYISTGAIRADHQLPAVNVLAKELKINFETVRKAYKELERDGLLSMKRGQGTRVVLHNTPTAPVRSAFNGAALGVEVLSGEYGLLEATKSALRKHLRQGMSLEEARKIVEQAFHEVSESAKQEIIFTECNTLQVKEISQLLKDYLNRPIKPVLIKDLKEELQNASPEGGPAPTIITTGFHVNEVREKARNLPVNIHVLVMNMSLNTRRKLDALGKDARLGFICRDQESAILYKDVLKVELDNPKLNLTCAILAETSKVRSLLKSVDALIVSPPVYEEIKGIAPAKLPVFNVFDRVDPMALKIIKDLIQADEDQAAGRLASLSHAGK